MKMQTKPGVIMPGLFFDPRSFTQQGAKDDSTMIDIDLDFVDSDKSAGITISPEAMTQLRQAITIAVGAAAGLLAALPTEPERKSKCLTDDPRHQAFLKREAAFRERLREEEAERQAWMASRVPPQGVISKPV